jgi:3-hydroxyacyl-[acyl-carrier-protein] dehydratase
VHRLDISEILALLPHRYPMLLIDRIIDMVPGEKLVALKNVTINEPFFTGHFPATPVMPGVLIVEAMGQAGGVLIMSDLPRNKIPGAVYFMGFDHVRFRMPVIPGDQMIIEVKIIKKRSNAIKHSHFVKISATAMVSEKLVAEGELMATYGDPA